MFWCQGYAPLKNQAILAECLGFSARLHSILGPPDSKQPRGHGRVALERTCVSDLGSGRSASRGLERVRLLLLAGLGMFVDELSPQDWVWGEMGYICPTAPYWHISDRTFTPPRAVRRSFIPPARVSPPTMSFSLARSWMLATCLGAMLVHASGVLETDLLFPLNKTYAPTDWFPVVFAFQNPKLAPLVDLDISVTLRNADNMGDVIFWPTDMTDIDWTNKTSDDPYFFYTYFSGFRTPGRWRVAWNVHWKSCNEFALFNTSMLPRAEMITNSTGWSTWFTIEDGGAPADIVADTARDSCPDEFAVPISVTDHTIRVPAGEEWSNGDMCAVVDPSPTPSPSPDPCRIDISEQVVESMEASLQARLCGSSSPPDDCPAKENAAQGLAIVGLSCFLAALGAVGFLLAPF